MRNKKTNPKYNPKQVKCKIYPQYNPKQIDKCIKTWKKRNLSHKCCFIKENYGSTFGEGNGCKL